MSLTVLTQLSQQTPAVPAQPAAQLISAAALAMLTARLGQTLDGLVAGQLGNGLTALRLGGETFAVRLQPQLPPGQPVRVTIQPSAQGVPALLVQAAPPVAQATVPPPLPRLAGLPTAPTAPKAAPAMMPVTPAVAEARTSSASLPSTPMASSRPVSVAGRPVLTPARAPEATSPPVPAAAQQARSGGAIQAGSPAPAPTSPADPSGAARPALAAVLPATGTETPAATRVAVPPGPAPTGATAVPATAGPGSTPLPPAPAVQPHMTAVPPPVGAATPVPSQPAQAPVLAVPLSPGPPLPGQPLPPPPPVSSVSSVFAAASSPAPQPATVPGAAPTPSSQRAFAAPSPPATPLRPTAVPTLNLNQPAQAAARQDSLVPLLGNLAALSARAVALPAPVAEAASRLLSQRLPLDRGPLPADTLRQAVVRAGVASIPTAGGQAPPDTRSALLQLRAGLLAMLGGDADIAPVAPVTRRPPPPMRDAPPRGFRSDGPSLPEAASPRDAARTLLHQTDAALSRLKLTQLASQPAEPRSGVPPTLDLTVEVPMMLGHELAMAQLNVQRDGKGKGKAGERGWRLRFAVNFSVVGEVGAQVSLLGGTTSVVLWAAETETARALEELLPELAPALAARGLEVGSVHLRRGAPKTPGTGSGRLMDQTR
jgi:hypothetical protein